MSPELTTMIQNNFDLIFKVMFGGSAASFAVSVLLATVVFDRVSPQSGLADQEMEMGCAFAATDQHIEIFQDAVLLLHIIVDIKDIIKTDENGENGEPGTIVDLFPVGSAAHGRGTVEFKIKSIPRSAMPDLSKRSQVTVPMAYIRESTFNELVKSAIKLSIFGIKTAAIGAWMGALFGAACIGAGAYLIHLDNKKTPVEEVDDEEEEGEE